MCIGITSQRAYLRPASQTAHQLIAHINQVFVTCYIWCAADRFDCVFHFTPSTYFQPDQHELQREGEGFCTVCKSLRNPLGLRTRFGVSVFYVWMESNRWILCPNFCKPWWLLGLLYMYCKDGNVLTKQWSQTKVFKFTLLIPSWLKTLCECSVIVNHESCAYFPTAQKQWGGGKKQRWKMVTWSIFLDTSIDSMCVWRPAFAQTCKQNWPW